MAELSKRRFCAALSGAAVAAGAFAFVERALAQAPSAAPADLASDEDFWSRIRAQYAPTRDFIQLENGYAALAAQPVLDAYIRHVRDVNAASSFYMRTRQADDKLALRGEL